MEVSIRPDMSEITKQVVESHGYEEAQYYCFFDSPSNVPYDYYTVVEEEEGGKPPILTWDRPMNKFVEISKISDPVRSVAGQRMTKSRVYIPDGACRDDLMKKLK